MYWRIQLITDGIQYELGESSIRNWEDVAFSDSRDEYDGVNQSFTKSFEFVGQARDIIREHYLANRLKSNITIAIFIQQNNWIFREKFRHRLDFTTYYEDISSIHISAIDDSLTQIIKAKKSQTYDIQASEFPNREGLINNLSFYYDRIFLTNIVGWIPYQQDNDKEDQTEYDFDLSLPNSGTGNYYGPIPMILIKEDIFPVKGENIGFQDLYNISLSQNQDGYASENWIFYSKVKKTAKVKAKFDYRLVNSGNLVIESFKLRLSYFSENGEYGGSYYITPWEGIYVGKFDIDMEIKINPNYPKLCFDIELYKQSGNTGRDAILIISDFEEFTIQYLTRDQPISIKAVRPVDMANFLLQRMTGSTQYKAEILNPSTNLSKSYLLAAESIRGIEEAKFHTSFKKFTDWMWAVYGFIYIIEGNTVKFLPRADNFTDEVVLDIGDYNYNEFDTTVNSGIIYSGITVGYDKKDYNSTNGRDEFHFTQEWETGLTIVDTNLDIKSPYRADVYGIEFLAQERSETSKDDKSDNDIFFVCADFENVGTSQLHDYALVPVRRGYTIDGVLQPDTMFNSMFSPRLMLMKHINFIGACTDTLKFTAADGNVDVTVNGTPETETININPNQVLYSVETIEFNIPGGDPIDNVYGLIRIENEGYIYTGYIKEASYYPLKLKSTTLNILVKSITKS